MCTSNSYMQQLTICCYLVSLPPWSWASTADQLMIVS